MGRKKSPNSKDNTTFITSHIPGPATYILAFSFSPSSVLIVCIDANTPQQLYDLVYKEESSTLVVSSSTTLNPRSTRKPCRYNGNKISINW
jgi:hypothetical protein